MTRIPISFEGEFADLKQKLSQMDSYIRQWGDGVAAVGKAAFAAWAGKQVFDGIMHGIGAVNSVLQDSVREATEAARSQAKLEAVIKATGGAAGFTAGEMSDYAAQLMAVVDIDDDVIKGAQAILATFREVKGENFKEATAAIIDMASVLGTDLQSAALQVGKALNDPTEGLTALNRAGVSFTAEQKELIKSLQETGDVAGAQKIILAELKNEFGGAGEAMANAAGHGLGRFQLMLSNVKEDLGGKLLPVLDQFFDTLGTKLKPVLDDVVERFGDWVGGLSGESINSFADAVVNLADTFAQLAESMAEDFLPVAESLLETVKSMIEMLPNSGVSNKSDRDWLNTLNDKQFANVQKALGTATLQYNNNDFWGAQGTMAAAGVDVRDAQDFLNFSKAAQDHQDKINRKIQAEHKLTGAANGSFTGPISAEQMWAMGMGMTAQNVTGAHRASSPAGGSIFSGGPAGIMGMMGMNLMLGQAADNFAFAGRMDAAGLSEDMIRSAIQQDMASKKDKGFQSSFIGAEEMYKRIAAGAGSRSSPEEKQVTLQERLVKLAEERQKEDAEVKRIMEQIRDKGLVLS